MNKADFNFSGMQDTARQIASLAALLRMTAERDDLFTTGDESIIEDVAALLQEKAVSLGTMLETAEAVAQG